MEQLHEDQITALEMLEHIKNYLEDTSAPQKYLQQCEFIENYILDLVCKYEATISLAEIEAN